MLIRCRGRRRRTPLGGVSVSGGVLAVAIRRLQQVFDRFRQLSRGEPAGRAFKTLDHGEAGDFAFEEGVQELGIVAEDHASVGWPFGPSM